MSPQPKKLLTVAFDLDGVIGEYHGFIGKDHLGPPNAEVVAAMRALSARGHTIIVHSTHESALLQSYCEEHQIPFDYINENPERAGGNKGKPIANVYVDDKAYRYTGQDAETLIRELESFRPYWKDIEE